MFKDTIIVNSVKKSAFVGFAFASLVAFSPAHAMYYDNNDNENFPDHAFYHRYVKPQNLVPFDLQNAHVQGSGKHAYRPVTETVHDEFMREVTSNVNKLVSPDPVELRKRQNKALKGESFDLSWFICLQKNKFNLLKNTKNPVKYGLFEWDGISWYANATEFDGFQQMGPIHKFELLSNERTFHGKKEFVEPNVGRCWYLINGTHNLKLTGIVNK